MLGRKARQERDLTGLRVLDRKRSRAPALPVPAAPVHLRRQNLPRQAECPAAALLAPVALQANPVREAVLRVKIQTVVPRLQVQAALLHPLQPLQRRAVKNLARTSLNGGVAFAIGIRRGDQTYRSSPSHTCPQCRFFDEFSISIFSANLCRGSTRESAGRK